MAAGLVTSEQRVEELKKDLLHKLEKLLLPGNALDELVEALGGPDKVAEMTGRKGRIVGAEGEKTFEKRSAATQTSQELVNITELHHYLGVSFLKVYVGFTCQIHH